MTVLSINEETKRGEGYKIPLAPPLQKGEEYHNPIHSSFHILTARFDLKY